MALYYTVFDRELYTPEINPDWNDYDKAVATGHLMTYGMIMLDGYGCPVDDEGEADSMFYSLIEDWDYVTGLMDSELQEEIHRDLDPCAPFNFLTEYGKRHKERFGETFSF